MSVRQYIGARYVPRFLGTWNNTTQYEALDVVDNGSGTSYIARKTVPAGTPLTNTEFWFIYGASSGAILDLQSRVSDIENNDIPALNEKVENKNFDALHGTNILFLADSFGLVGWGDWCDYVKTKMGSAYNVTVNATAGDTLKEFADKLDSIPDGTYDDILMVCGTNDIYTNMATVTSQYNYFKAKIAGKYNQTRLHYGFVATRYANATQRALIKPCNMLYQKLCGELGIRYLGNFNKYLFPAFQFLMGDGIHPTVIGGKRLASAIGKAFCDCCEIYNEDVIYNDADNALNFKVLFDITDGGALMIKIGYGTNKVITIDGQYHNISIPSGNYQSLTSLDDAAFSFTDSRPDTLVYFNIDRTGFRWAGFGSGGTFSTFAFAFTSLSALDLDAAVNA